MSGVIQRLSKNISSLLKARGSNLEVSDMTSLSHQAALNVNEFTIPVREISTGDATRFANIPLADKDTIANFVNQVDTFIFDCDGVIVRIYLYREYSCVKGFCKKKKIFSYLFFLL